MLAMRMLQLSGLGWQSYRTSFLGMFHTVERLGHADLASGPLRA